MTQGVRFYKAIELQYVLSKRKPNMVLKIFIKNCFPKLNMANNIVLVQCANAWIEEA